MNLMPWSYNPVIMIAKEIQRTVTLIPPGVHQQICCLTVAVKIQPMASLHNQVLTKNQLTKLFHQIQTGPLKENRI
jgi:hypothetical protein